MTRRKKPSKPRAPKARKPARSGLRIPEGFSVPAANRKRLTGPLITDWSDYLKPAAPPPGVVPANTPRLAMDDALAPFSAWAANSFYNLAFVEGYTFLGYPYLSQLAQIPEYRLISETIATESTRKWIKIQSETATDKRTGQTKDAKAAKKIKDLDTELERLGARAAFKLISEQDGFFGRSHLYLDTGDTDKLEELQKPIGDGGAFTEKKFKKGFLRALKTIEPVWCYPARYNANDPLKDEWYRPDTWFVMGKEVHASRLLTFVGRPVPDLLKPAFSFGGLSLSQMVKPYVDNWLETRQSVNDITHAFSVMVLVTDLSAMLSDGGATLAGRIQLFNNLRDNSGVFAISKADEDFKNVSAPLGTLDKLQAQAQEHMASISRIPLIKLTGISPTGLNASSEGEIRVFYDSIHAYQQSFFSPHLRTVFRLAQINLWGAVDPDLTFIYNPLWELDEVQRSAKRKTDAETDAIYIESDVLSPGDVRRKIVEEPESPYASLDPDDVPEIEDPLLGNIHERVDEEDDVTGENGAPGPDDQREAA